MRLGRMPRPERADCSHRLVTVARTLRPPSPSTLTGCSVNEFGRPPTRALARAPMPIAAPAEAPTEPPSSVPGPPLPLSANTAHTSVTLLLQPASAPARLITAA